MLHWLLGAACSLFPAPVGPSPQSSASVSLQPAGAAPATAEDTPALAAIPVDGDRAEEAQAPDLR